MKKITALMLALALVASAMCSMAYASVTKRTGSYKGKSWSARHEVLSDYVSSYFYYSGNLEIAVSQTTEYRKPNQPSFVRITKQVDTGYNNAACYSFPPNGELRVTTSTASFSVLKGGANLVVIKGTP